MSTDASSRVIVSCGTTHDAAQVNHRDFPEIRTEGETPKIAAEHLVNQLTRALDSALTAYRRDQIQSAIDEVKAFAAES